MLQNVLTSTPIMVRVRMVHFGTRDVTAIVHIVCMIQVNRQVFVLNWTTCLFNSKESCPNTNRITLNIIITHGFVWIVGTTYVSYTNHIQIII